MTVNGLHLPSPSGLATRSVPQAPPVDPLLTDYFYLAMPMKAMNNWYFSKSLQNATPTPNGTDTLGPSTMLGWLTTETDLNNWIDRTSAYFPRTVSSPKSLFVLQDSNYGSITGNPDVDLVSWSVWHEPNPLTGTTPAGVIRFDCRFGIIPDTTVATNDYLDVYYLHAPVPPGTHLADFGPGDDHVALTAGLDNRDHTRIFVQTSVDFAAGEAAIMGGRVLRFQTTMVCPANGHAGFSPQLFISPPGNHAGAVEVMATFMSTDT